MSVLCLDPKQLTDSYSLGTTAWRNSIQCTTCHQDDGFQCKSWCSSHSHYYISYNSTVPSGIFFSCSADRFTHLFCLICEICFYLHANVILCYGKNIMPCVICVVWQNQPISQLGSMTLPWKLTATLVKVSTSYSSNVTLIGTTEVSHSNGYFTFTNLGISHKGTYKIEFKVSDPTTAAHFK